MRDRWVAAALVALIHAGALYLALLPRTAVPRDDTRALATFDVAPPPPPLSAPAPPRAASAAPKDAGHRGRAARRTPIVAPVAVVTPVAPPIVAAAAPQDGSAAQGGTSEAGPGTGAGIGGWGSGAGGNGDGIGGRPAQRVAGTIADRDYPAAARRLRAEGIATVRFLVGTDGRVGGCRIVRSAGDAALDAATCRLIEERFRYRPAQDAAGRDVAEERGWQQRWWLER